MRTTERRRATAIAFVVAALAGLALEATVLGSGDLPYGVRSLFIAAGAAGGTWLAWGEL
ncbi:hypothetical protein [Halosegnis marinus]|uniref:Uncharacterized protein n=1 Tax=Halosegnis marinus TaxID=3034023 RepID=A0ABD5ZQW4_9EURY|nr:hypothetical protein [Halosegnis sp. DT85]